MLNIKDYKITFVNMNIGEDVVFTSKYDGYETIEDTLNIINNFIYETKRILDDEYSIYEHFDLKMVNESVTKEDIIYLMENADDYECITIAENPKDIDYCVYLKIEKELRNEMSL